MFLTTSPKIHEAKLIEWKKERLKKNIKEIMVEVAFSNLKNQKGILWITAAWEIPPHATLQPYCFQISSSLPGGSDGKAPACRAGDPGSIPGLGRSPGGGNGNPLQYSCIDTSVDRGAWWATACEVRVWDSWSTEQATHTRLFLHAEGPSCMGWNGDSPTQARISQLEGLDKAHCWALACLVLI